MNVFLSPKNKKRKSKGKGKKTKTEESRGDEREEGDAETVPALLKGRAEEKQPASFLYPSWKLNSSDSEFSDLEGNAQSKLRYRKTLNKIFFSHACVSFKSINRCF